MSTLFFLSHICSVNTFSSANYMPNHVLDSGDVDFLAVHTPLLSLIVFFFQFPDLETNYSRAVQ